MCLILNFDTSTFVCSVALCKTGEVISLKENKQDLQHARLLTVFIEKVLKEATIKADSLDAVGVSGGPGSFTGLRIGTAVAKGLCYAANIPLVAINTLEALAYAAISTHREKNSLYLPMINLKRMEVYTALFRADGEEVLTSACHNIGKDFLSTHFRKNKIFIFGNGAEKSKNVLNHPNAVFLDGIDSSAAYMAQLSQKAFQQKKFQDIKDFEPFYLKDFVPTKPRKKFF